MLHLYSPVAGTQTLNLISTNGVDGVSDQLLLLNILIELRVMNAIAMEAQRGLVTETPAQYREDVVNSTVLPFK